MSKLPFNRDTVLEQIYTDIAKLGFGDLLLLQSQISEHIFNCWQHHQLQVEKHKSPTRPSEQSLEQKKLEKKPEKNATKH